MDDGLIRIQPSTRPQLGGKQQPCCSRPGGCAPGSVSQSLTPVWSKYPVADQMEIVEALRENGNHVAYREITSVHGHDAFLMEWDQLSDAIGPFLSEAGNADASQGH